MEDFRTCAICGTLLVIGETCNCQQPVDGFQHKDGLRATCPLFSHRSTYRNRYFIACKRGDGTRMRQEFRSNSERNDAYARRCCRGGQGCRSLGDETTDAREGE